MEKRIVIPFSQALLNKLRCFEHESHSFKAKYLEEINDLSIGLLKQSGLKQQIRNYEPEKIILAFHYYLALIDNVQTFIDLFDGVIKTEPLNVQGFNSTNIFNVHSFLKAFQALRASKPEEERTVKDLHIFKGFNFILTDQAKEPASKSELLISLDLVNKRSKVKFLARSRLEFERKVRFKHCFRHQ
jgi:hypothetical protein